MVTALRVHVPYWTDDEQLRRLFDWLAQTPGTFDELAFFTSETHPPAPLPLMLERAHRLKAVMAQARTRGYRAGINVLATMGHHEENLPGSLDQPWQRVTDPRGRECRGCYCPEDPCFQEYVRAIYTAFAQAEPDFVWIDDDVRLMGHAPIAAACFCSRCVQRFAEELGRGNRNLAEFTPSVVEGLGTSWVAAAEGPPTPERLELRRAWLEHNRGTIDRLHAIIEQAAHAARPGLELGFMTGDRFYEGYAFRRWAETLSGPEGAPVRWRPGGGFYWDDTLMGLVGKAHDLGRQAAALPHWVTVIQSEVENFPYHVLRKSAVTTVLESAAYMAAGVTGAAFNLLPQGAAALDEVRPIRDRIAQARPFLKRLHEELGRSRVLGIWPAWNGDLWTVNGDPGSWFDGGLAGRFLNAPYALGELGLPLCYSRDGATMTALSGRMPLAFPREELELMLRGGVLLDAEALEVLWDLGLGEMAGVRPGAAFPVDAIEVLTDHSLNSPAVGWKRNARQSFWQQTARALEPCAQRVQILSRLTDYLGGDLGPCLSIYENPQGGRVAVAGYYPWSFTDSAAKIWQYRALARWLSRGRLPAVVESLAKVVLWARAGAMGRQAVIVLNASLDPQPELALVVRMATGEVEHVPMAGAARALSTEPASEPDYRRVVVPDVAPWSAHLLLFDAGVRPNQDGGR